MKDNWTSNADYSVEYLETDDPRVVLIIERDDNAELPYDDGMAPTLVAYDYGSRANFTQIGAASEVPDAWLKARTEYRDDDLADRFVSIFYGATVHRTASSLDRYSWAIAFDNPQWREDMGIDPDTELTGQRLTAEVRAYMDGDVYGIGYAICPQRTTTEFEADPFQRIRDNGPAQEWDVNMECWGFYGEEYAKECAQDSGYIPDLKLDTLMDGTMPTAA